MSCNFTDLYLSDLAAWCNIDYVLSEGEFPFENDHHIYLNGVEIKDLIIPDEINSICWHAFEGCSYITSVTIPNSMVSIGRSAFRGCSGITSIIIPPNVTSIGSNAFSGCTGLKSVNIPQNVTSLGSGAFSNCSGLVSVTIPNGMTSIYGSTFSGCNELTSITIPNSITDIYDNAFSGCTSLTSLTIPNSVKRIGNMAFSGCSGLTSVSIPSSVTSIGWYAFNNCPKLLDVYCFAENVPSTDEGAFYKSYVEYVTLHVPESSIEAYKTTAPWSGFKEYVALPNYKLTYIVDGEVYKTYKYEEGRRVLVEEAPEKEGYTFSGWSEIPETMPDHDVEVTGTFTVNKYNLIYMVDGEEYKTVEIEYGAEITPEDGPEKEGYTFMGWSEIPETMPANDVTVTGIYEKNLLGKCATPIIAYANDELTFSSETEDVEFVYDIKVNGSTSGTGNKVKVATTLTVNVYAKKDGYENSDVAMKEIQPKFGDLSGDGEVNAVDLTKLIEILLKQ